MIDESLLSYVSDIVCAHVSNNAVTPSDVPNLIQSVHTALAGLGKEQTPVVEKQTPAVSIRASVKHDAIVCLECGERMKMLKRHLTTDHQLTPADYKSKWQLPMDYPLVAPEYAAKRRDLAVKIGLGRKAKKNKPEEVKPKKTREPRKTLSPAFESAPQP